MLRELLFSELAVNDFFHGLCMHPKAHLCTKGKGMMGNLMDVKHRNARAVYLFFMPLFLLSSGTCSVASMLQEKSGEGSVQ